MSFTVELGVVVSAFFLFTPDLTFDLKNNCFSKQGALGQLENAKTQINCQLKFSVT